MFNCPHDQEIVHLCNEYASKQCEDSFLWLGFYSAVAWQLSWYQNSHQDPILTLQEVLELLAFAFECSHWLFVPPL